MLLSATLLFSSAYSPHSSASPTHTPQSSTGHISAFKTDLLGDAIYEANLDPLTFEGTGTAGPAPPIIVGPNVRVNAPQLPFPNGLLGRSETTIGVGEDATGDGQAGNNMVVGYNDANGFGRPPFAIPGFVPGNPGLSGYAFSTDGGTTWTDGDTPPLFAATTPFFSGDVVTRGDPWITVSRVNMQDTYIYANLAVFKQLDSTGGIVDAGVSVHRGTFNGQSFTWNDARVLSAPNAPFDLYDKEAIIANGKTVIFSVTNFIGISTPGTNPDFCQFGGGFGQIEVWRSSDGGVTFQGPAIAAPDITDTSVDKNCTTGTLNQGSDPAIGANGNIFVAYTKGPDFNNGTVVQPVTSAIMGASSSNSGQSFSAPVVIRAIVPGRYSPPVGYNRATINDFPRAAYAQSGNRLFVVFQDASAAGNAGIGGSGTVCLPASGNPSPGAPCPAGQRRVKLGGGADLDVYLSYSDDNGKTWSSPTLVNAAAGDGKIQLWPVVTVGAHGEVNVIYYEIREVQLNPDPTVIECAVNIGGGLTRRSIRTSLADTFLSRSMDGGVTFQAPVRVSSVTSNWCTAATNIRPNFGDYIGATTVGSQTFAVWGDARNTVMINGVSRHIVDTFYATIGTTAGDTDFDFHVDITDLARVGAAFGSRLGDPNYTLAADLDHSGTIDITDLALAASHFGT